MNQTVNYIKELTAIASPTGFTREISDYLVHTLEELGYQPVRTAKGGVNVTIKGQNDKQQRYVTAHVDTLGAIVGAVAGAYYGIPAWIQEKALSMMPDYMVEDYEDFKAMYMDK